MACKKFESNILFFPTLSHIQARTASLTIMIFTLFVTYAHSIKMVLRPHSVECFSEHPGVSQDLVTGSFFVENLNGFSGKEASFDLTVTDPRSKEVYNAFGETEHKFEYHANTPGVYTVCFTNTGDVSEQLTYFSHIGHHWDHGKATKTHLDSVLEALQNLDARVALVSEESKYHKHRAVRHARTTTSTQSRVKLMALLESAVMILATAFQLLFVKRLFRQRESVDYGRVDRNRYGI